MLWSLMNSTHKLFVEKLNKIGCKIASNNENVICKQTTNGENEKKISCSDRITFIKLKSY